MVQTLSPRPRRSAVHARALASQLVTHRRLAHVRIPGILSTETALSWERTLLAVLAPILTRTTSGSLASIGRIGAGSREREGFRSILTLLTPSPFSINAVRRMARPSACPMKTLPRGLQGSCRGAMRGGAQRR
jgi:hypothetical protein